MTRLLSAVLAGTVAASSAAADRPELANPAIDSGGYRRMTTAALDLREKRRVSEAEFIKMSHEPGTIVLDARSKDKYDRLHVKGALSLPFPDITVESVQRLLPDKAAQILIYCNNNFSGAQGAFPSKMAEGALNLSTFTSLYTYGYRNIYELAPLLDARQAKLEFEGTDAAELSAGSRPGVGRSSARMTVTKTR
jgi:hypothetical protein